MNNLALFFLCIGLPLPTLRQRCVTLTLTRYRYRRILGRRRVVERKRLENWIHQRSWHETRTADWRTCSRNGTDFDVADRAVSESVAKIVTPRSMWSLRAIFEAKAFCSECRFRTKSLQTSRGGVGGKERSKYVDSTSAFSAQRSFNFWHHVTGYFRCVSKAPRSTTVTVTIPIPSSLRVISHDQTTRINWNRRTQIT